MSIKVVHLKFRNCLLGVHNFGVDVGFCSDRLHFVISDHTCNFVTLGVIYESENEFKSWRKSSKSD